VTGNDGSYARVVYTRELSMENVAKWTLLVMLAVGGTACKDPGADGFMKNGALTDLPADSLMASDTCPPMDSVVDAASGDGGDAPAGRQCGGSGTAVVASTHGSFELHSVFVVVYTCGGSGFTVQFADDSTPRRTVEFYVPLSPGDPTARRSLSVTRPGGRTTWVS
jgi:hypothetical protein